MLSRRSVMNLHLIPLADNSDLLLGHLYEHTYAFLKLEPSFTYKGPEKSVLMSKNGKKVDTLSSGSDPIFCVQVPSRCFWQGTHLLITRLCSRLLWVSQIFRHKTESTVSGHACNICEHLVSTLQLLDVRAATLFGACSLHEGRQTVVLHLI